jgi:hypothetical protein
MTGALFFFFLMILTESFSGSKTLVASPGVRRRDKTKMHEWLMSARFVPFREY